MQYNAAAIRRFEEDAQPDVHWDRVGIDGCPYRGPVPRYTDEEYEQKVGRVHDPYNSMFDLSDPEQNAAYLRVVNRVVNNRAICLCWERIITAESQRVYMEWLDPYMEDGAFPRLAANQNPPRT